MARFERNISLDEMLYASWWLNFSKVWDRCEEFNYIGEYLKQYSEVERNSKLDNGYFVDIGCANLELFEGLKINPPLNYLGIEPSMVISSLRNDRFKKVKIINKPIENVHAAKMPAKYIFCFWVLHIIDNPLTVMRFIEEALLPGGKALISIPDKDDDLYDEVERVMASLFPSCQMQKKYFHANLVNAYFNKCSDIKIREIGFTGKIKFSSSLVDRSIQMLDICRQILGKKTNTEIIEKLVTNQGIITKVADDIEEKSILIELHREQ